MTCSICGVATVRCSRSDCDERCVLTTTLGKRSVDTLKPCSVCLISSTSFTTHRSYHFSLSNYIRDAFADKSQCLTFVFPFRGHFECVSYSTLTLLLIRTCPRAVNKLVAICNLNTGESHGGAWALVIMCNMGRRKVRQREVGQREMGRREVRTGDGATRGGATRGGATRGGATRGDARWGNAR